MSAASSRASGDSSSASSGQECASPGRSSRTPTAAPSSPDTSPTPPASRTCERSAAETSTRSTSSAAASPARTSAAPAEEPGSTAPARVFGLSLPGSFASFDPATSSWRTCPPSSPGRASDGSEGRSDEFSATWPKHGMTRSGRAYRLESSGHPTCESGSGSWPTPHGMPKPGQRRNPGPSGNELGRAVNEAERRSWPTPTRSDSQGGPGNSGRQGGENLKTAVAREARTWPTPINGAGQGGRQLREAVAREERLPTPTAQAGKHAAPTDWEKANRPRDLHVRAGGPLNPQWVEWLMGFPTGWTALPPSATPSSRRSRSGSCAASSNTSARDGS